MVGSPEAGLTLVNLINDVRKLHDNGMRSASYGALPKLIMNWLKNDKLLLLVSLVIS